MSGFEPGSTLTTTPAFSVVRTPPDPVRRIEGWLALGVTFVLAVHYRLSPDVNAGYLVAVAFLPVTFGMVKRYRGAGPILLLAVAAAVSGLVLTWLAASNGLADHSRAIVQTARVLGLAVGMLAMLWTRSVVGTRATVLTYGLGFGVGVLIAGPDFDNIWKFSFSVPVTLVVLSLPGVFGNRRVEAAALVGLAAVSAVNDSRSAAAMMLIAAALVVTQGAKHLSRQARAGGVLVRLVLIGVAGFYLSQALVLDGTLGEAAKTRTVEQIQTSGSVLLGGRPEIGASSNLILHQPLGYGAGAEASSNEILTAKAGMARIGYDPNNGYVETYMFGDGFEVHSLLGDLWILFGIAGLLLGIAMLVFTVMGMARAVSLGAASAAVLFLSIRMCWDFGFSPFPSAMDTLMLALAVVLPLAPRHRRGE